MYGSQPTSGSRGGGAPGAPPPQRPQTYDFCIFLLILIPVETIDCISHCEVADDHCLNMSRHRPSMLPNC